jgi:hypothetical protein
LSEVWLSVTSSMMWQRPLMLSAAFRDLAPLRIA